MRATVSGTLQTSATAPAAKVSSRPFFPAGAWALREARVGGLPLYRLALAATVATAVIVLALSSLLALMSGPDAAFRFESRGDGTMTVGWVMAGGTAAEAGLRAGDVVRPVPVPDGARGWLAVQILSGDRSGSTAVFARRWDPAVDLVLLILGMEFLSVGLLVFLRASDRSGARSFAVLAGLLAATLVAFPAIGSGVPWALCWEWFGSKLGMASFAYFFLTVPSPRWGVLRRILLWWPAPVLAFYCYTVFVRPDLYSVTKLLGYSYMVTAITVSVAAMLWPLVTRSGRTDRRLWPVAVGGGLAGGNFVLGGLLPYLLTGRYLLPIEFSILGLGFIPLGFAWAMLRYPMMGVSLGPWAVVRTVFDSITDPIFVIGRDGMLVEASRTGLALLGIERARRATRPFLQLVAPCTPDAAGTSQEWPLALRRALSGQPVQDVELPMRLPSGELAYMSIAGTPLLDEKGRVEMAVLVLRDVTARKQREIARREMEIQKDEFFSSVSHDLRTPLTAIKYSVGVVLANEPRDFPEPLHRMLANVDLGVDRMATLVDDILELARLQSSHAPPELGRCDLRVLLRRSAAAVEALVASRGQTLSLEVPSRACTAMADSGGLERAVTNLLSNAHKYGRDGGSISLRLARRPSEFLIAVSDDGPGIPEGEQGRIFERFYRAGDHGNSARAGSGLGLPIARALVELHGGRLWVESTPGAGATFWMAIPAVPTRDSRSEVVS